MNLVRTEQGTGARYFSSTHLDAFSILIYFITLFSSIHSGRLFLDDYSTRDSRSDSTEHAFDPVRNSQNLA